MHSFRPTQLLAPPNASSMVPVQDWRPQYFWLSMDAGLIYIQSHDILEVSAGHMLHGDENGIRSQAKPEILPPSPQDRVTLMIERTHIQVVPSLSLCLSPGVSLIADPPPPAKALGPGGLQPVRCSLDSFDKYHRSRIYFPSIGEII